MKLLIILHKYIFWPNEYSLINHCKVKHKIIQIGLKTPSNCHLPAEHFSINIVLIWYFLLCPTKQSFCFLLLMYKILLKFTSKSNQPFRRLTKLNRHNIQFYFTLTLVLSMSIDVKKESRHVCLFVCICVSMCNVY